MHEVAFKEELSCVKASPSFIELCQNLEAGLVSAYKLVISIVCEDKLHLRAHCWVVVRQREERV